MERKKQKDLGWILKEWPIRFDTVKDMPEAMEVSSTGNWIEHGDYEKLLNMAAKMIIVAFPSFHTIDLLKASILNQLKNDAKNG
jgi:hypothetical protein